MMSRCSMWRIRTLVGIVILGMAYLPSSLSVRVLRDSERTYVSYILLRPAAAVAEEAFVQVANAAVRSAPQHWASTIAPVRYGDSLTVLSSVGETKQGVPGWMRVKIGAREGFIHRSAVSDRRVVIEGKRGGAVQETNSGDVVLAGKGFNSKVESTYASRGANVNFAAVNDMLRTNVSDAEVRSFVAAGKLGGGL